jgi:hypothetical protein
MVPPSDNGDLFEQAQTNVRRAGEPVARQREIIAGLKAKGIDIKAAEERLLYLERSLALFAHELAKLPKR